MINVKKLKLFTITTFYVWGLIFAQFCFADNCWGSNEYSESRLTETDNALTNINTSDSHLHVFTIEPEIIYQLAQSVLEAEAKAILNLRGRINKNFIEACELLIGCKGKIIVTGMGKSGHIANKIAATLTSTGSPALFMHPGEAGHGDIGVVAKGDVIIALSNSGNTEELLAILQAIKLLKVPLISITGNPNSDLAKAANINLDVSVEKEACPLGLTPTSSTTATLAMGDALAVALLEIRGFTAKDFARSHPSGILGKRLLLHVDNVMHTGNDIPKVRKETLLAEAIREMNNKCMGMIVVTENNGALAGVFTDDEFKQVIDKNLDIYNTKTSSVMTMNYKTIASGEAVMEAVQMMKQYKINFLIIADENNLPIGIIHKHDLLKTGLI